MGIIPADDRRSMRRVVVVGYRQVHFWFTVMITFSYFDYTLDHILLVENGTLSFFPISDECAIGFCYLAVPLPAVRCGTLTVLSYFCGGR